MMQRRELENKIIANLQNLKTAIESKPTRACAVALVAGMLLIVFKKILIPLALIGGVFLAAIWFFAEPNAAAGTGDAKDLDRTDLQ